MMHRDDCLNVVLFIIIPKGFFPQQDTGTLNGSIQASQDISFDAMRVKQRQFSDIVMHDPAVRQSLCLLSAAARSIPGACSSG